MTPTDPNIRAEARAVEEGHRAFLDGDGPRPRIRVVSDSQPGKRYFVTADSPRSGLGITFTCTPDGTAAYRDDHKATASTSPGVVPCKHAALAARRLAREGLAQLAYPYGSDRTSGSKWVATIKAERLADQAASASGDPFAGFPR